MDDPNAVTPPEMQAQPIGVKPWRWWVHLGLLAAYPVVAGVASMHAGSNHRTLLPTNTVALGKTIAIELAFSAVLFALAWLASRANAEQLLLKWRGGLWPILRGFFYSIGLRLGVFLILLIVAVPFMLLAGLDENAVKQLRPEIEHVVNAQALKQNPVYLWLNLTVVSFLLAGLREELWRVGILAGLAALFPRKFGTPLGQMVAVGIAAVIFGVGHLSQGWGGVALTSVLGLGLGAIMVIQHSIWEAVLAHGFFNATTFVLLCLITR